MAPPTPTILPKPFSTVGRRLLRPVGLVTLYCALVWAFNLYFHYLNKKYSHIPLVNSVASLARCWRSDRLPHQYGLRPLVGGPQALGQLMKCSRNLAIKVRSFNAVSHSEMWDFGRLVLNSPVPEDSLREGVRARHLTMYSRIDAAVEASKHVAAGRRLRGCRERIAGWRRKGLIDELERRFAADPHVRGLMDVCGGCERIRRTPFVPSYRPNFVVRSIAIYLLALPWGLIVDLEYSSGVRDGNRGLFHARPGIGRREVAEPLAAARTTCCSTTSAGFWKRRSTRSSRRASSSRRTRERANRACQKPRIASSSAWKSTSSC